MVVMESEILTTIAVKIKKFRLNMNLSQEELANKAELHRTYISLIERKKKNVSIIILQRIADALEVEIKDLITR